MRSAIQALELSETGMSRALVKIDAARLGPLFELHQAALWRLGVRMLGDPDRAHDLVQDTLLRALGRKLPSEDAEARAWLIRTLVNLCRDLHRRRAVRRAHADRVTEDQTERSAPPSPEGAAVARTTLEPAIRRLPARRRAVLVLHELEQLSARDIARSLGLAPVTVRWHLSRARKDLRRHLSQESRHE